MIREVPAKYRTFGDNGRLAKIPALFTPEAQWQGG
jgi:hypothetical protein